MKHVILILLSALLAATIAENRYRMIVYQNDGRTYSRITNMIDSVRFEKIPDNIEGDEVFGGMRLIKSKGQSTTIEGKTTEFIYDFYIDTVEVTQAEYERVTGSNPSYYMGLPNNPVETVSWFDAAIYCNTRSLKEGREPVYYSDGKVADSSTAQGQYPNYVDWYIDSTKNGYRLPTEAEWQYAYQAGTTTPYYWGEGADFSTIDQYAWYFLNSDKPQEGAQKLPNQFGLYDMSGNIKEWVNEWHGSMGIRRGGCCESKITPLRVDYRDTNGGASGKYKAEGFRVVLVYKSSSL